MFFFHFISGVSRQKHTGSTPRSGCTQATGKVSTLTRQGERDKMTDLVRVKGIRGLTSSG